MIANINKINKVNSTIVKSIVKNFTKKPEMSNTEIIDACKKHTLFAWSVQKNVNPLQIVKAEGCNFWDGDGKKWFDLNSQLMCVNVGHQHPKVIQAIKDQADELCYGGPPFATRARAEAGTILAKHTPGDLNKFFFALGGSEANENAMKIAKQYTGRSKLMVRNRSYHGATYGSMTLTGDPRRWACEPGIPGVVRVENPYSYRSLLYSEGMPEEEFSQRVLDMTEQTMKYENPESIAAFFLETVTGANGIIPPPKGYLQGLRKLLSKYGILMVCDEVMCGVGRTGEWYAVDHWDVVPDMLIMAKGLTSAYMPLGAVAVSNKISNYFEDNMMSCGLTYQCHPMAMATCAAVMTVMEDEDLVGNSKRMGKIMAELMAGLKERHPSIGETRSIGLFGGIEFVKCRKTKEPMAPYGQTSEAMLKLQGFLKENGVFAFNLFNVLHTIPPLTITEKELRDVFAILDKACEITDRYCVAPQDCHESPCCYK
jgi:taurine--2-oxoglutarate transaminase